MSDQQPSRPPPLPEDFHRQLIWAAAVAMLATDADYRIVCWNDAAGRLLAVRPDEMLGKSIYDLIPPSRHRLLGKLLARTARPGEAAHLDVRLPGPDAREMDLVLLLSPVPDGKGGTAGVAAWILDQTRRTQLSTRLANAEKLAALGTLSAGVAHHFNNILGGVATFVDFALSSGDPAAMKRALQMTAEAAARASKITQSLLSFAKKDYRRSDLADLTELVMTFAHLVERPLAERDVKLQVDIKPVPVVAVQADHMNRALGNLLANAEEALGEEGGTVSISLAADKDEVVLTFADDGCGIGPEELPQVFEPFFTTKSSLAGGEGAHPGLGLSVVHGLVTEMGGRIDVQSSPNQGTTFHIRFDLPAKQAD